MRVFNINKAMGYASSGVEYAQKYRRGILDGIPWVDDRYVFTDYMPTNPAAFAERLGFRPAQVLWIYDLVAGRETRPSTMTREAVIESLGPGVEVTQAGADVTDAALPGTAVRHRIRTLDGGAVDRVETLVRDQVVRIEHYDATLGNVEHFHDGRLARRVFFTEDGRVAAEQFYRDREIARTVITPASPLYADAGAHRRPSSYRGDRVLEGRSQFFRFVFGRLLDRPSDVVIVDRALDVIDGVYPVLGGRRLYSVVHAEHVDLARLDDGVLLWNNHYENVFTRPELVTGLIVSTERQKAVLERQLAESGGDAGPAVVRIPVGTVAEPAAAPGYDRLAVVTASRLADEKHVDVLIKAVAAARRTVPGLRFDIYGEGDRQPLLTAIRDAHAEGFVRLMGHQDLRGVLGGYALYVSASTSEGFGLSLLEAIGEGLPIVGFDVDYGNRELVEPGVNGTLVPRASGGRDVDALAGAIAELLGSASLDDMRRQSLRKAEAYTVPRVRELWEGLLREEPAC